MKVGLIGLGAVGRVHYGCWRKSAQARLVAVSDRDEKLLAGKWAGQAFNIGNDVQEDVDLSDLARYQRAEDLIADAEIDIVDICLPTPLHASLVAAALRAGKHVFCEKPMSLSVAACALMEETARLANRQLMIGHCLRFWPQYVKAGELLQSRQYGQVLYAELHRSSPAPIWSDDDWYMKREESGGIFDMHIHDIDVALWWFGRPQHISTTGYAPRGLPMIVDAAWQYEGGRAVQLHASWDRHGGVFRHAFRLIMEKATLIHDLAVDPQALRLLHGGKVTEIAIGVESGYQAELDYFAGEIAAGRTPQRPSTAESRMAVELGLEELRQLGASPESGEG